MAWTHGTDLDAIDGSPVYDRAPLLQGDGTTRRGTRTSLSAEMLRDYWEHPHACTPFTWTGSVPPRPVSGWGRVAVAVTADVLAAARLDRRRAVRVRSAA